MKTVGIRFRPAGKVYTFDPGDLELASGDRVVVETERGMAIGHVAWVPVEAESPPPKPLKKLLRVAEEKDVLRARENRAVEVEARRDCMALIAEKKLDMKLLSIDMVFDRSKMIFFFASEGRVDFRELVRDLARQFHTRIEMRQVGVRDEAKMVGGLGCCGRELCCATWMQEFAPISVRMAKSQNISLNPAKISGICGRLMCCLSFENKMYEQLSKNMPKLGKRVETAKGEGKVVRRNALEGTFVIFTQGGEVELTLEEFQGIRKEASREPSDRETGEEAVTLREQPGVREAQPEEEGVEEPEGEEQEPISAEDGSSTESAASGETKADDQAGRKSSGRRRRRRRRKPSQEREKKSDG